MTKAGLRPARAAVAALFLTNGALFANIVPRYPELKASLGLSNAALGAALAWSPLGALLAGLFAAAAIRRFRSSRAAALGIVLLAAATLLIPAAPNWVALAAVLFLVGALDAAVDVAQNAHGLRVQRRYGRSIVNSFHGVWCIGAVTGGLMGSAAAGLAVPVAVHLGISAALFSFVALVAYRYLLPGPEDAERAAEAQGLAAADGHAAAPPAARTGLRAVTGHTLRILAALGVLAACGALVEDAGASWGAIYLSGDLHTSVAAAGLAFIALQTAMTIGRLLGDRAVDRFGQATVVRAGGALTAAGMGLALAMPSVGATLTGFALAGLGVAPARPGGDARRRRTSRTAHRCRPHHRRLATTGRVPAFPATGRPGRRPDQSARRAAQRRPRRRGHCRPRPHPRRADGGPIRLTSYGVGSRSNAGSAAVIARSPWRPLHGRSRVILAVNRAAECRTYRP